MACAGGMKKGIVGRYLSILFCFGCGDAGDSDADARFVLGRPRPMCRNRISRAFLDGGWDGNKQTVRRSCAPRNLLHGWKGIFFRPSAAGLVASNRIHCHRFLSEGCCPHPPSQKRFGIFLSTLRLDWWRFHRVPHSRSRVGAKAEDLFFPIGFDAVSIGYEPGVKWDPTHGFVHVWFPDPPLASSVATCPMGSHLSFPQGIDGTRRKEGKPWRNGGVSIEIRPFHQPGGGGTDWHATHDGHRMAESQSTHHRTAAPTIRSSGTCVQTNVQA